MQDTPLKKDPLEQSKLTAEKLERREEHARSLKDAATRPVNARVSSRSAKLLDIIHQSYF